MILRSFIVFVICVLHHGPHLLLAVPLKLSEIDLGQVDRMLEHFTGDPCRRSMLEASMSPLEGCHDFMTSLAKLRANPALSRLILPGCLILQNSRCEWYYLPFGRVCVADVTTPNGQTIPNVLLEKCVALKKTPVSSNSYGTNSPKIPIKSP
nr:PREDICTED: uncharacterized protein LOC109037559 [Bemisia tabaci]